MKFLLVDIRKRVGNLTKPHYAVQRIQDTLDAKNIKHESCHYDEIGIETIDNNLSITAKGVLLNEYTHIIIRGHRTHSEYMLKQYIVSYAQENGIHVQNSEFIKLLPHYNKLIQLILLSQAGIPYVDSYYSVDGRYWEHEAALKRIGFPLIYKHTEGEYRIDIIDGKPKTKKNVYLVKNVEELKKECLDRDDIEDPFLTKDSKYFIQKYVDIGEDYRAIMIGDSFLSGWKRKATRNFLTVSKGEYSLYDKPTEDFLTLVQDTARLLRADYCAVDVIYVDERPYVLEVNMNPGFKAFETKLEGSTVNVAEAIVDDMLKK